MFVFSSSKNDVLWKKQVVQLVIQTMAHDFLEKKILLWYVACASHLSHKKY